MINKQFENLYATAFAEQGHKVVITPKFDGGKFCPDYDNIYGGLKGTKYYGKCPDFSVDDMWYEYVGFSTNNPKRAFGNILKMDSNNLTGCYRDFILNIVH